MANEQAAAETKAIAQYRLDMPAESQGTLKAFLGTPNVMKSLAEVAAKHLTPERLTKMVIMAASRQPEILDCTLESILKATMTSAQLGLDCSGVLGRAYLVPFWNNKVDPRRREILFMPGYLGLVDLVRNTGNLKDIMAEVVYKTDKFKVIKGSNPDIIHEEDPESEQEDQDIIGAYMIAWLQDGSRHQHWMPRKKIEKARAISKAKDSGPWKSHYAEMCKKTVIRQGVKLLPMSVDTQQQFAIADEQEFDFNAAKVGTTVTLEPTQGRQKWGFSTEPQEPSPADDPPATQPSLTDPPKELWQEVQEEFEARCAQLNMKSGSKSRSQAFDHLMKAAEIEDWPEINTAEKADAARAWMKESMSQ